VVVLSGQQQQKGAHKAGGKGEWGRKLPIMEKCI